MGLQVEEVPCCVCGAAGKVPRFIFWLRDCAVCDGSGKRKIVMDADFPDDIKDELRLSATYGINRYPVGGMGNSLTNAVFGRGGIF